MKIKNHSAKLGSGDSLYDSDPFGVDNEINILVETCKGSSNKLKYEAEKGLFSPDKTLSKKMEFPYDYGFVPSTLGKDGEPLDVVVLSETDVSPGSSVEARLIGSIQAWKKETSQPELNEYLIAVDARCSTWEKTSELRELPRGVVDQIERFFISYHNLHGIAFHPCGRRGTKHAEKLILEGVKRFQKSKACRVLPALSSGR